MADGDKSTSTPAPQPAASNGSIPGGLAKSYRGIGIDQAYREGFASYRGVNPGPAGAKPAPPLVGAPANAAPAVPAKQTGNTSNK